jgi:ComF family protein
LLPPPVPDLSPAAVAAWRAWDGDECPRCGAFVAAGPSGADPAPCPDCAIAPPPFTSRSLFPYEGPAGEAIRAIKYGRRAVPSAAIAGRLLDDGVRGRWAPRFPDDFRPVVVPVPILPLKYLRRGFNLPSLLACAFGRLAGWRCDTALLERVSGSGAQAKQPRAARGTNVEAAFRIARRAAAVPADVVLIDDVYTTGATAAACAGILKRGGARHIVVLTVARAVLSRDRVPETR